MCLRSQVSMKDGASPQKSRAVLAKPIRADTKSYTKSTWLVFKLVQGFVCPFCFYTASTWQDLACRRRAEGVCSCADSPCGATPGVPQEATGAHHHSCLPLLSASPCQIQPKEHPSQHKWIPSGCLLSFQGFARDLQGLQSGSKVPFVLRCRINLYQCSGIRDCQGQGQGPPKPLPLSGNSL